MKKYVLLLTALFLSLTLSSFSPGDDEYAVSKIVGKWEYIAPDFNWIYQKGTIEFSYDENDLTAEVKIGEMQFLLENLVKEKNIVRGHVTYNGSRIYLYIKFYEDMFQATISNSWTYKRVEGKRVAQDEIFVAN